MRDYGKVHTSFWASETLHGLDDDAKLLALYLLTCTHSNMAGAFRLPAGYVNEDMGWDSERFRKGYETLSACGFLEYCPTTKWVWIVKFLEWNKPENPNQWKAVAKFLSAIPKNCSFQGKGFERVPEQFRNSPVPVPVPVPKKEKRVKREVTLTDWIVGLDGELAVPAEDPIFDWAAKVGIPRDWIALAWWAFEGRYTGDGQGRAKTYADWRATFRNAVREDWLKLWRSGPEGYVLTTAGQQAQREMQP